MAHRTISDEDFLNKALDLFRTYGFEGVSLKQLADATGLEKASLYHRYPGGKDQIAMAAAGQVVQWFQANVIEPLQGKRPPRERVIVVADRLRTFYLDGEKSCISDVLSIAGGPDTLQAGLKSAMQSWIKAFVRIAVESGFSPAASKSLAEDAVIRIEGSLVLGRVLGDNAPFRRTIKSLPDILTGKQASQDRSAGPVAHMPAEATLS